MKKIRTWWFENWVDKDMPAETRASDAVVKHVADQALVKYEKTFRDLARYDRGEKILTSVSH